MNGDALLGDAEALVAKAIKEGADEAEVYLEAGASLDVEVEADRINSANASTTRGGAVRVIKDGHLGFAYFSDPSEAPGAIAQALALSRLSPRSSYSLPKPGRLPSVPDRWDDALAALDDALAVELAKGLVAGVKETFAAATVAGGGAGMGWGVEAIANSHGIACWDRSTHVHVGGGIALEDGDVSLNAWDSAEAHKGSVDAMALGRSVTETIVSLRAPRPAVEGKADVILLPDAAGSLLGSGVLPAIEGDAAARGRSVWSEALESPVAHDGLGLLDDTTWPGALGVTPFDGEGQATGRVPIIEQGVLRRFIYDSRDAHRHGQEGTHHAVRGGFKSPPLTGTHHTVLTHKNARPMDALIGGVDAGYLVESVLGAHTANAATGDFSVTAPNVWRIEAGELVGACEAVAVAGNLPALLRRADAVSDEPRYRDGSCMPALRLRDVAVSC